MSKKEDCSKNSQTWQAETAAHVLSFGLFFVSIYEIEDFCAVELSLACVL